MLAKKSAETIRSVNFDRERSLKFKNSSKNQTIRRKESKKPRNNDVRDDSALGSDKNVRKCAISIVLSIVVADPDCPITPSQEAPRVVAVTWGGR